MRAVSSDVVLLGNASSQTVDLESAYLVHCFQLPRRLGLELGGRATVLAAEA